MRTIINIVGILVVILLLFAAYDMRQKEDTFSLLQKSLAQEDWAGAEKYLLVYLEEELDMEKSWQAWVTLIDVSKKAALHPDVIVSYLDDMMLDYGHDASKKKYILFHKAAFTESKGNLDDSIAALEKYAHLSNLSANEAYVAYKKLLQFYFRQSNFTSAEDILHDCLALTISEDDTAFCLYNLAEIYAGKGSYDTAHEFLQQLEYLSISKYRQSQVYFLHADILEQQRKYKEALEYFKLALDNYGNKAVVQQRIDALEKLLTKK